jgi:SHOCT-like protein
MTDPLERILELVASGRLTADEAAPILEALEAKGADGAKSGDDARFAAGATSDSAATGSEQQGTARYARVEVRERGRRVVDLRVPISLGRFALSRVPGLSREQITEVEEAVVSGARGPIFDVEDDDGDGVRIVLE